MRNLHTWWYSKKEKFVINEKIIIKHIVVYIFFCKRKIEDKVVDWSFAYFWWSIWWLIRSDIFSLFSVFVFWQKKILLIRKSGKIDFEKFENKTSKKESNVRKFRKIRILNSERFEKNKTINTKQWRTYTRAHILFQIKLINQLNAS